MATGLLLALLGAVVPVAVSVPASADTPPPTTAADEAAAGWLARQLVDGERMETIFGDTAFPDQGLTADTVLALDAAKVAQDNAAKATAWLSRSDILTGYVGDGTTESYAGAHAKLALVAQAQGGDPTSFGGIDAIARLLSLQAPSGRFSDRSAFGDFSNGITQSLAIIALHRHGGAPAGAVNYLAGSQCADGGFPLTFEQPTCASDVDTTGFATQAMLAAGRNGEAGRALDWLQSRQSPDGGFGGSGPTTGENANSTGLAAQALRAGDRTAAADRAVAFLAGLRVDCTGPPADHGAIAYDASGFSHDTAVRATAQATFALAGVGLAEVGATGATGPAPALDCGGATSTPPTTEPTSSERPTTSATSPTSSSPPAGASTTTAASTTPVAAVAGGRPTKLAHTGSDLPMLVGIGGLVLLAGAAIVLITRQRRHASKAER